MRHYIIFIISYYVIECSEILGAEGVENSWLLTVMIVFVSLVENCSTLTPEVFPDVGFQLKPMASGNFIK